MRSVPEPTGSSPIFRDLGFVNARRNLLPGPHGDDHQQERGQGVCLRSQGGSVMVGLGRVESHGVAAVEGAGPVAHRDDDRTAQAVDELLAVVLRRPTRTVELHDRVAPDASREFAAQDRRESGLKAKLAQTLAFRRIVDVEGIVVFRDPPVDRFGHADVPAALFAAMDAKRLVAYGAGELVQKCGECDSDFVEGRGRDRLARLKPNEGIAADPGPRREFLSGESKPKPPLANPLTDRGKVFHPFFMTARPSEIRREIIFVHWSFTGSSHHTDKDPFGRKSLVAVWSERRSQWHQDLDLWRRSH